MTQTTIEQVRRGATASGARVALFDFDGTLSLIRSGWVDVMVPMMVEALLATGTSESRAELTAIVEEFVTRLTGHPTMQQMYALCDEVEKRGQPRPDPSVYFNRYMDMLLSRTAARVFLPRHFAPTDGEIGLGALNPYRDAQQDAEEQRKTMLRRRQAAALAQRFEITV